MVDYICTANKEFLDPKKALVNISEFEIDTEKGVQIKIFMIKPIDLPKDNNPAYIYAHGGAGIMFDAASNNDLMSHTALNLNCVVFNVDYRLGPEAKAPKGQMDMVAAVRHISKNASKYGVDNN